MFNWLRSLIRAAPDPPADPEPMRRQTVRRWEGAETDRLNRAHWQNVTGNSINVDLLADLETLRTRCAFEASNNPMLEGVIRTHCDDVVGPEGPVLQVQSESEDYNEYLEEAWGDWFRRPTTHPGISGVEMLKMWVRDLWINGEYLAQKVTNRDDKRIGLRLKLIHPRRLATPADRAGNADIVMGVVLSNDGVPRAYLIANPKRQGAFELDPANFERVPPDDVVHRFLMQEADQVRGVPLAAPNLNVIADLRDYDLQVLDAARQAADHAVILWTTHADARYVEVNESVEIERRTISNAPPGWQVSQVTPQQPSTTYVEYRRERMAELGRPVSMPLMMVRLDAQRHNYSSARFDGQNYSRAIESFQAWTGAGTLSPLVDDVAREVDLVAALGRSGAQIPARPRRVRYVWIWPTRPHVDPEKERKAERLGMENGTVNYIDALAATGKTLEDAIAKRVRANKALAAAGLPPLPTATPGSAPVEDDVDAGDGDESAEEVEEHEDAT